MSATPDYFSSSGLPGNLRIRPWRELALVASIMMELSWVALWYRIFIPADKQITYLIGLLVLTAMLMMIYLPNRVMSILDTRLFLRRGILVLLLLVNILIGSQNPACISMSQSASMSCLIDPCGRSATWQI